MELNQELQHWGIKGQKWGVRRYQNPDGTLTEAGKKRYYYQNPDGSLTEEGKKHYMEAARKGKLDPKKLSDADLNMINQRFAREKTYAQNVSDYEKSKFSYKLKEAVITRIKGNGGGGGGKKGGGGKGIGAFLAMPIKKAIEDAVKFDPSKGGGDKEEKKDTPEAEFYKCSKKGRHFFENGYHEDKSQRAAREANGRRFMEMNSRPSKSSEDILRDRQRTKSIANQVSNHWSFDDYSIDHSGIRIRDKYGDDFDGICFAITRSSDTLAHYGILGQKWGVRRFQNEDGTLTEAGKARIAKTAGSGYLNPSNEDRKKGHTSERDKVSKKYSSEYWKLVDNGMDKNSPSKEGKKLWDKFKTEYASATLKDLKMNDTQQARKEVKKILAQIDPNYFYPNAVDVKSSTNH